MLEIAALLVTVREAILFVTYVVVVFSILVQGLSLGRVVRALAPESAVS